MKNHTAEKPGSENSLPSEDFNLMKNLRCMDES